PWNKGSLESLPPLESPNGVFVAFSWSRDGHSLAGHRVVGTINDGISVYWFDSGRYQHFTDFGWAARWLSDSQRLIFWKFTGIYLLDTRSGKVQQIYSPAARQVMGVAPSPDDRRIYFGLRSTEADIWLMTRQSSSALGIPH